MKNNIPPNHLTPSDQLPPMTIPERQMWAAAHKLPRNLILIAVSEMNEMARSIAELKQLAQARGSLVANIVAHYFKITELRESGDFEGAAKQAVEFTKGLEAVRKEYPITPAPPKTEDDLTKAFDAAGDRCDRCDPSFDCWQLGEGCRHPEAK